MLFSQKLVENVSCSSTPRIWQRDRVQASRLTTRLCARIRRKTTSIACASLTLPISVWLTFRKFTACMFAQNGSLLSECSDIEELTSKTIFHLSRGYRNGRLLRGRMLQTHDACCGGDCLRVPKRLSRASKRVPVVHPVQGRFTWTVFCPSRSTPFALYGAPPVRMLRSPV